MIWETIKAFSIINNCLDEDYSNVLAWLNEQLAIVWEDRGAFPGLGAMLCALEVSQGIIIAKQMQEGMDDNEDIWEQLDAVIAHPKKYLGSLIAESITPITNHYLKWWLLARETSYSITHDRSKEAGQKTQAQPALLQQAEDALVHLVCLGF